MLSLCLTHTHSISPEPCQQQLASKMFKKGRETEFNQGKNQSWMEVYKIQGLRRREEGRKEGSEGTEGVWAEFNKQGTSQI